MKTKNNIRYSLESNSYIEAQDWQGKGQPELKRIPATEWRVIVSDPARYEGCEIYTFKSKSLAQSFIDSQI